MISSFSVKYDSRRFWQRIDRFPSTKEETLCESFLRSFHSFMKLREQQWVGVLLFCEIRVFLYKEEIPVQKFAWNSSLEQIQQSFSLLSYRQYAVFCLLYHQRERGRGIGRRIILEKFLHIFHSFVKLESHGELVSSVFGKLGFGRYLCQQRRSFVWTLPSMVHSLSS